MFFSPVVFAARALTRVPWRALLWRIPWGGCTGTVIWWAAAPRWCRSCLLLPRSPTTRPRGIPCPRPPTFFIDFIFLTSDIFLNAIFDFEFWLILFQKFCNFFRLFVCFEKSSNLGQFWSFYSSAIKQIRNLVNERSIMCFVFVSVRRRQFWFGGKILRWNFEVWIINFWVSHMEKIKRVIIEKIWKKKTKKHNKIALEIMNKKKN